MRSTPLLTGVTSPPPARRRQRHDDVIVVSNAEDVGPAGMNIGNAIASILIADLFDKDGDTGGHPLRPERRRSGNRPNRTQRGSNSFAAHPERW